MQVDSTSSSAPQYAATLTLGDDSPSDEREPLEEPQADGFTRIQLEAEILAVLEQHPRDGESRDLAFKRKEHQLGALFAQLVPAESLALEERLRVAQPGDPIAAQFKRFVVARQLRLLAFLADSRKRHPLQLVGATVAGG